MDAYVPAVEQLVTEIVVRDIKQSANFYRRLGFKLLRDGGDFIELTWEDHRCKGCASSLLKAMRARFA